MTHFNIIDRTILIIKEPPNMILKFLNKIPAGMMVIPLLLGSVIATLFP